MSKLISQQSYSAHYYLSSIILSFATEKGEYVLCFFSLCFC